MTNFPKDHKENGENKNAQHRTDEKFKDFVRIFKNLRGLLVDLELLKQDQVASYNIECLVYNTPDNHFSPDYQASLKNILNFFLNHPNPGSFLTVSHQHLLFGVEDHQWKVTEAQAFAALVSAIYTN